MIEDCNACGMCSPNERNQSALKEPHRCLINQDILKHESTRSDRIIPSSRCVMSEYLLGHLCYTCKFCFANCDNGTEGEDFFFGMGVGFDNVWKCKRYEKEDL